MNILGIESSCDDTGAAVVRDGTELLSNIVASQDKLHATFGGVVPEIASRAHIEVIQATVEAALEDADLTLSDLDAVAVTHKPGLIGALLVGVQSARSLAWGLEIPCLPIDHLEAHVYATTLARDPATPDPIAPPFLSLVVSGGHTEFYFWRGPGDYDHLGGTRDDAVGEAFDKVAVMLGLSYPGGPAVEKAARSGDPEAIHFKRILLDRDSLDFSFSGLKTAVLYHLKGQDAQGEDVTPPRDEVPDVAASFQACVVDTLIEKIRRAIARSGCTKLAVGGGVARNGPLRTALQNLAREEELSVVYPPPRLCTDNAAMVAGLAGAYLKAGAPVPEQFETRAR